MVKNERKNIRAIRQLTVDIPCYFYGYFKSPGLKEYPNCDWVNEDYHIIRSGNIDQANCQRIAQNLFNIGLEFNIFNTLDYIVMVPLKSTSVSSLEIVIKELIRLIAVNLNKEIKFINDIFHVSDYRKFWENRLKISERKEEIANKITFNPKYYHFFNNKDLLIIDDIVSTGISIADIALLLKTNNVKLHLAALCYGSVYHWEQIYS